MEFPNPIARADGPATSHQAAADADASGLRDRHAARVLALVRTRPGSTAIELMEAQTETDGRLRLNEYQIRRRLTDLAAAQLVEQGPARACRVRGSQMVTWSPRAPDPPAAGLFDNAAPAKLPD